MRTNLPAWLNPHSTPLGLEAAVDKTTGHLRTGKQFVWLTGHAALAVAGVAVRHLSDPVVGVRLAGSEQLSDALLQLGWALELPSPGNRTDIASALMRRRNTSIVVDCRGAPHSLTPQFREAIASYSTHCRWLMIVRDTHAPSSAVNTGKRQTPQQELNPSKLPKASHALGWLTAGIPGATKGISSSLVPGIIRQAVWPALATNLQRKSPIDPSDIATELALRFDQHLSLAMDGLQPQGVVPADMFALRWIGRMVNEPTTSGYATIAASRLMLRWGQAPEARELLCHGLEHALDHRAPGAVRGLLQWAEARTCLESGDPKTAANRFSDATATLREVRALSLLACMTRRWADLLAVRGDTSTAARHYRDARAVYRQSADNSGVRATLRGAADLSVAAGELVSAEALYDQVDASGGSAIELANLRLGQCAIAINRGEHHRALNLIQAAVRSAPHVGMLVANGSRRKADLALREGRYKEATQHARAAQVAYARVGAAVASTRCIRLLGDIAAMGGRLKEAADHYARAVVEQVQTGDRKGLRTSLNHAATLEEFSGDMELASELRRMLNKLDAAA